MADQNTNYREDRTEAKKSDIEDDVEFDPSPPSGWDTEQLENILYALYSAGTVLSPNLQKLYRAAMDGKWETARAIIGKDPNTKTKRISFLGFTALHVAASCGRSDFVVELVKLLTKEELEITDQLGRTALHHVALAASVEAAKAMVNKNQNLPHLGDMDLKTPLLYAAQWRHPSKSKEMLEYLYQVTRDKPPCHAFTGRSASNLIVAVTASGSYDIAFRILNQYSELAYEKNDKGMSILHVLAMQPSAFRSGNKLSLWKTFHWISKVSEIERRHLRAVRLVEFVCEGLQKKSIKVIQEFFLPKDDTSILHLAVEHGVFELVQICLQYFPDLIWYADKKKHLLLHVAIEQRQVDIFNYIIHLIGENTKAYAELIDEDHNNSLHLAAKLAPPPQLQSVPSPAFQMQQEVQWYKAVEELVYYESKTETNKKEKTPRELFIEEHKDLLKDAKEWMKDTSNSSMLVAALVATVAFAAMITVPGGNDSGTGVPILSQQKLFIAFTLSNALSMMSSIISLLLFLSIQTSRYTEKDFLNPLPSVLLYGLIFLVIAVATMMISFGTAIGLSLKKRINWAYIPIMAVACCPAIIFYQLQLPLIFQMLLFKSGPGIFQRKRDRKLWRLNRIGYHTLANGNLDLLPSFAATKKNCNKNHS